MTLPLDIYLSDHFAGATGGAAMIRRISRAHDGPRGAELERLAIDIGDDRSTLLEIMRRVDARPRRYKVAGAWLAESWQD